MAVVQGLGGLPLRGVGFETVALDGLLVGGQGRAAVHQRASIRLRIKAELAGHRLENSAVCRIAAGASALVQLA